jgi:rhamnosyltransferase
VTNNDAERIFAVVVTYLPQVQPLVDLLTVLAPQVTRILVVDNTSMDDDRVDSLCQKLHFPNVELTRLGSNFGIAKAFNIGIEAAISEGATHVLLSDQDSQPSFDMVSGLVRAEIELKKSGVPLAAIGPSFTNINSGDLFPFLVDVKGSLFFGRRSASPEHPHIEALTLISSGTLISVAAIKAIGLMREDFFIDSVDTEWCYRARALGYRLYGTAWATMLHRMGDSSLRVWYFGWFRANAYSPLRVYYQIRNLVRLHYLGYKGIRWRIRNIWSILGIFYFHVLYGKNRLEALRMAFRGLSDAFGGRMGKFEP